MAEKKLKYDQVESAPSKIKNASDVEQFEYLISEGFQITGAGDTTVSFNAANKRITINSTPGSGSGGAVTSFNSRTGGVVATEGDYSLNLLGDVTINTPINNNTLLYNSSNTQWENKPLNTSVVPELTNLYFTEARTRNTPITGFLSGAGALTPTDTLLQAINKLDGNFITADANNVKLTGNQTITGSKNFDLTINANNGVDIKGTYLFSTINVPSTSFSATAFTRFANRLTLINDAKAISFNIDNVSALRTLTIPDQSGTIALTNNPTSITATAHVTTGGTADQLVGGDGVLQDKSQFQTALTNPVTGTGTTGQVSFWNGTNTQTGDNQLFWDNTTKAFGVGTNTVTFAKNTLKGTLANDSSSESLLLYLPDAVQAGVFGSKQGLFVSQINLGGTNGKFTLGVGDSGSRLFDLGIQVNGAERILIKRSGRVLFGTNTDNGVDIGQFNGSVIASGYKIPSGLATQALSANGSTIDLSSNVTGTGVAGQVSFWNGTATQTGDSGLFWNNVNKRLGVGISSPQYPLDILGDFRVSSPAGVPCLLKISGASNLIKQVSFETNGISRWNIRCDDSAESGSNVGSDFRILRRNDAGSPIDETFFIKRSTGNIGINTAVPLEKLDVRGKVLINKTSTNGIDDLQVAGTISASPATQPNQVVVKSQLDALGIGGGTYSPVSSSLVNVTSPALNVSTYTTINGIVSVTVGLGLNTTTLNTNSYVSITLPISRNTGLKFIGNGVFYNTDTPKKYIPVFVKTTTTNTATLEFVSPSSGNQTLEGVVTFQYQI
jgi:hypothetical protein